MYKLSLEEEQESAMPPFPCSLRMLARMGNQRNAPAKEY